MTKKLIMVAVGILLVAGVASAQRGTIAGSAHDFSAAAWGDGTICTPCHAPHNNQNASGELLWNHDPSVATYTFYDSPSMNATQATAMVNISKACLSCHDGTVNVDAYGGAAGTVPIDAAYNLGTALEVHHPVSIAFCDTTGGANATVCDGGADAEVNDRSTSMGTFAKTIGDYLDGTGATATLECSSCHDVHNNEVYDPAGASLLYVSNAASALCLTCHDK